MDKPIFHIPQKQYVGESAVISMRLPKDMLTDIDEAARISGRTRNEVLTMGLEFALQHMVITSISKPEEAGTLRKGG
ncbi:MAG: hypothetical protein IKP19_10605 [Oscillospiraceae bacterium]|nr:hypothetical protein [Oscillospiraceae bacterium]